MRDLASTQGEEFKNIRVKSELLPESQICFDLVDFDVPNYSLIGKIGSGEGVASTLIVTVIEPGTGSSDVDVKKWSERDVSSMRMNSTRC